MTQAERKSLTRDTLVRIDVDQIKYKPENHDLTYKAWKAEIEKRKQQTAKVRVWLGPTLTFGNAILDYPATDTLPAVSLHVPKKWVIIA